MNTIHVYKAQPIGDQVIVGVLIRVDTELPQFPFLTDARSVYEKEGETIENALHASLPGGSYDALLRAMLDRTASLLRVPMGTQDDAL